MVWYINYISELLFKKIISCNISWKKSCQPAINPYAGPSWWSSG